MIVAASVVAPAEGEDDSLVANLVLAPANGEDDSPGTALVLAPADGSPGTGTGTGASVPETVTELMIAGSPVVQLALSTGRAVVSLLSLEVPNV